MNFKIKLLSLHLEKFLCYSTMAEDKKKSTHGGRREGAGRPKQMTSKKLYSFYAGDDISKYIDSQKNKSQFIKECVRIGVNTIYNDDDAEPDFSQIGKAYPAENVEDLEMPFFDIGVRAGFPVPLDNDQRAETINLLGMMCPNPESCYMVRVEGDSMIDANIHDGDVIIVDKSQRNPSEHQVAVCEYEGEYTIKYFKKRGNEGWLIPANPDYPEIHIQEGDRFSIWGVVTYVIHRPG